MPIRKISIFVSSPTDVMAERQRALLVIDRHPWDGLSDRDTRHGEVGRE